GEPVFRVLRYAYALPQNITIPENLADFCCDRIFENIDHSNMVQLADYQLGHVVF
ncbi:unnamed protein product, partial [marine sediment metagenome]